MDKNVIMTYGILVVVALSITILIMLATPFGDYIGEAYVRTVRGGKDTVDHALNEGFQEKTDEFNKEMNEGTFVAFVDSGLYETGTNYGSTPYMPNHELLTSTWDYLIDNNVMFLDNNTLRTRYNNENGTNQSSPYLMGDIVIASAAVSLDKYCFAGCSGISSVYIKGTQIINEGAFKNCTKLKTLYISENTLAYVMKDAFSGTNLSDIYFNGTTSEFDKIKWEQFGTNSVKIHCLDGDFQHNI